MLDFLSHATVIVRRRTHTVIASRHAIDKRPVVLPDTHLPSRFELRETSSPEYGHHVVLVRTTLVPVGAEALPSQPLLTFRDADHAQAALARVEASLLQPWWRKAVRVYQVLGFIVALLATMAFWNTLMVPHPAPVARVQPADITPATDPMPMGTNVTPPTTMNPPVTPSTLATAPNELSQAQINALIQRQREAIEAQQNQQRMGTPAVPATMPPAPTTGTPGDAVVNALKSK